MDSYFSLLNLSFVENCHISIFTTFAKQSMINRLSNPINRNRSAAKIPKVMSSTVDAVDTVDITYNVDMVYTVDMIYTVDTVTTVTNISVMT